MRMDKKVYDINTYKNCNVKIVQISDIHFSYNYKISRLRNVLDKIDVINPDYVCIVGDLIDEYDIVSSDEFSFFIDWLKRLSSKYKVIVSLGNHDFIVKKGKKYCEILDIDWLLNIKNDNMIILNNEVYSENGINFIGYNPDFKYYYDFKEKNSIKYNNELSNLINNLNGYNILLLHTPSMITVNDNYKIIKGFNLIDLVLCGHTHGGMIPSFFPGSFGIVSPYKSLFPKCVRGKKRYGKADLLISSGIVKLSRKSNLTKLNDIYSYNINVINIKKI